MAENTFDQIQNKIILYFISKIIIPYTKRIKPRRKLKHLLSIVFTSLFVIMWLLVASKSKLFEEPFLVYGEIIILK